MGEQTATIPLNTRSPLHGPSKRLALVVEQDELARTIATDIAAAAGFEVHAASCCDSAIAYIANHGAVEVLLVAARLPEMSGYELAAMLSRDFPEMLSVFLVRADDKYSHGPMLRYPFTLHDLAHTLETLGALPPGVRT
jgi:CheY-like chemotaxis protein